MLRQVKTISQSDLILTFNRFQMYQNCWLAVLPCVFNSVEYFLFESLQANSFCLVLITGFQQRQTQSFWKIKSNEKSQIKLETATVTEDLVMLKNASEKSKTFGSLCFIYFFYLHGFQIASSGVFFSFCKRC